MLLLCTDWNHKLQAMVISYVFLGLLFTNTASIYGFANTSKTNLKYVCKQVDILTSINQTPQILQSLFMV